MADIYAEIIGDKQLIANLNALAPKIKKKIMKPAMRKGAAAIAKRAKRKVKKRSGMLQKSIKAKATKNGNGQVYVDMKAAGEYKGKRVVPKNYAHLVEFGTRTSAAHPFMRSALAEGKNEAFQATTAEAQKQFGKLAAQGKTMLK